MGSVTGMAGAKGLLRQTLIGESTCRTVIQWSVVSSGILALARAAQIQLQYVNTRDLATGALGGSTIISSTFMAPSLRSDTVIFVPLLDQSTTEELLIRNSICSFGSKL